MSKLLDPDTILKYGTKPNAVADFERFVQSHIEIHDKYNFSMVKRIEESPFKVGFIDDIYHFYTSTDADIIFYEIDKETGVVTEFYRYQAKSRIQNVAQNPFNSYLFALLSSGEITLFNLSTKTSEAIKLDQPVIQIAWMNKKQSIVTLFWDLTVGLVDLEHVQVFGTRNPFESQIDSHILVAHPNFDMAAICDDKLRLIDFRDSPKILETELKQHATAVSWLPNDNFGCALGFANGDLDFFSFKSNETVMHQNITKDSIYGIEFCPANPSAVSLIVENNILFASMPSWGFGNVGEVGTYKMHLAPILDAHWIADDKYASMISCDADHMIHIFDVPEEYIPIYEAGI